jgi:aspartate-semialdehyde dehydrogenase
MKNSVIVIVTSLLLINCVKMNEDLADLSNLRMGFLGCGKISSAVVRGYCACDQPPLKIYVSKRSEDRSKVLAEQYPSIVEISDSNDYIVKNSNVVFIGLLPNVAREILPQLNFDGKNVITMMAAVNYDEVVMICVYLVLRNEIFIQGDRVDKIKYEFLP